MFSTLTPLSLRWVWGQLSRGSWVGTSWWCLVRDFGKLVHKALFQGGKALPGQGSSVCPPPYSCLKITTSLHRPSVRGDHHGRSPGDGGLGLRGPNKPGPWQNAKVRVSTDLPLAQCLSCPKNKTKQKKPEKCQGQTFHAEPGCTLCSYTSRYWCLLGTLGPSCPYGGSEWRVAPVFPCWVEPRPFALEAWFPRSPLIPDCSAS